MKGCEACAENGSDKVIYNIFTYNIIVLEALKEYEYEWYGNKRLNFVHRCKGDVTFH